jgi:hypothetical protein
VARLILQSAETFQFLHVSPRNGDVTWTPSLLTAIRHGIVSDEEQASQLIEDHSYAGSVIVVDLDQGER